METLPDLDDDAIIELAREGGFAWIPRLAGLRRIALADMPPERRAYLCDIIRRTLPLAREPGQPDSPGRGDRFYYRIHIRYRHPARQQQAELILLIPEDQAPPELTALWRDGA